MADRYKVLIQQHQDSSLKSVLKKALDYHYSNFVKLESLGSPWTMEGRTSDGDFAMKTKANSEIKLEIQAYINQLRRLKHFINYLRRDNRIQPPEDIKLLQTWKDLMTDEGIVNTLANKWAAHRSVDDPKKGDTNNLHLEVLLNLESETTMWSRGHTYLYISSREFYLFDYHAQALKFIDWVFENIAVDTSKSE